MPSRDDIIYSISNYSAKEITDFLIDRIITVNDILEENPSEFSLTLRREVEKLLWDYAIDNDSERDYDLYLANYPKASPDNHTEQAIRFKAQLFEPSTMKPKDEGQPLPPPPPPPPRPVEKPTDPWELVDKTNIDSLEDFRDKYPDHPMYIEAGKLIARLEASHFMPKGPEWLKEELSKLSAQDHAETIARAFNNKQITKNELIDLFKENHNFINKDEVIKLRDVYYILTKRDLEKAGIPEEFIQVLMGTYTGLVQNKVNVTAMENPEMINFRCQEFYFWGMPASGKTCALGAILSAASSGEVANSLDPVPSCKGYAYMNQLQGTFQPGKISELPPGTDGDFVADMSFNLIDKNNKSHAITLIDIAGELLDTMRRIDENDLKNIKADAMKGYQCMINLLVSRTSKNSKIHFFVVEYGGHDREHKGMKQAQLLDSALTHIDQQGVLNNSDAVYILMTKADQAFNQPGNINEVLNNYLFEHYQGFFNRLKSIINRRGIKRLDFIPFSIGEVCFKNLCKFDSTIANQVVQILINDTRGERTGKIGGIIGGLRS